MDINAYAPDLEYAVRPSPLDQGQVVDKVLVRGRGPGPKLLTANTPLAIVRNSSEKEREAAQVVQAYQEEMQGIC